MKHNYKIVENNILLRPLEESDALLMRVLRNLKKHCFLTQYEISQEQQIAWFRNYLTKENDYMFTISLSEAPSSFVGAIGLYDIANARAEVGRVIVDKDRFPQRGIGTAAVFAACKIGFKELGLQVIYAKVLTENIASLTVFRKLRFSELGEKDGCIHFEMDRERFAVLNGIDEA